MLIALVVETYLHSPPKYEARLARTSASDANLPRRSIGNAGRDAPAGSELAVTASMTAATTPTIDAIEAARARIAGTAVRTPLLELQGTTGPRIFLKLENLQPINSFKLRGAANAVAMLDRRTTGARSLDDQRRQRRPGRRLRGAQGRRAVHGRRDRDGARDEDRADARARSERDRRRRSTRAGKPSSAGRSPESRARSCIRSTTTTSSRATRPPASRSSRTCPALPP